MLGRFIVGTNVCRLRVVGSPLNSLRPLNPRDEAGGSSVSRRRLFSKKSSPLVSFTPRPSPSAPFFGTQLTENARESQRALPFFQIGQNQQNFLLQKNPRSWFSTKEYPPHQIISLPALSPTMEKGNLVEWKKKEGDFIDNDCVAVIETDKSTMEWEYSDEGYLAKILVSPSEGLVVGAPLAIIVDDKEDIEAFKDYSIETSSSESGSGSKAAPEDSTSPPPSPSSSAAPSPPSSSPSTSSTLYANENSILTPSVMRLINEHHIDVTEIVGTGPTLHLKGSLKQGPLVLKADILQYIKDGKPSRKQTSTSQLSSQQQQQQQKKGPSHSPSSASRPPHVYMSSNVSVDGVVLAEKNLSSYGVTANHLITHAIVEAIRRAPSSINSVWSEDSVLQYSTIDLLVRSFNVEEDFEELQSRRCLIQNVEGKGVLDIKEKLDANEENSLGTFGLTLATNESLVAHNELLEPSHSCSLVIGPIQKGLSISEEGTPKLSHSSQLSLTYDGRVVSDEDAAQFLASVNQFLSDPLSLL